MKKMKTLKNISTQDRQPPFTTPAGYFENLTERVMEAIDRKQSTGSSRQRSAIIHYLLPTVPRSWLAAAAGLALLLGTTLVALNLTKTPPFDNPEEVALSSYFNTFDIQTYQEMMSEATDEADNEAIMDYLLFNRSSFLSAGYYLN